MVAANKLNARKQIKIGAVLSYATVGFNAVAGLLYTPWMVGCIGADDYGLYTIAISVVNFFILDFGLSDAVARYMSKYLAEGSIDKASRFLGVVYKMFFAISAAVFIALLIVFLNINSIYSNITGDQLEKFKVIFAVVAAYSVVSLPFIPPKGILRAGERFVVLNGIQLLQKVFTVGLIVVALLFGRGVLALVVVNAATTVVFSFASLVASRRLVGVKADIAYWDKREALDVTGFSLWITVAQISQRFTFSIAPTILAAYSSTWEVALFGLAASMESYVYSIASAVTGLFMRRVADVSENKDAIQRLMTAVGRFQVLVIGIVFTGFVSLGQRFFVCWMGEGYELLYPCTLLLILPSLVELPSSVGDTALIMKGYVKERALVYGSMAIANIVCLNLFSYFGALGASASICIAYCIRTLGKNYFYSKRLGVSLAVFYGQVYGKWLVFALPLMIVAFVAFDAVPYGGIAVFAAMVLLYSVIYLLLAYFLFMNSEERRVFRIVLKR